MRVGIWGNRSARFGIAGVCFLISGVWMGYAALNAASLPSRADVRARSEQELTLQARLFADAIWSALDGIKTRLISLNTAAMAAPNASVPPELFGNAIHHWSVPVVRGGKVQEFVRTAVRPGFSPADGSLSAFDQRFTTQVNQVLRVDEVLARGQGIYPFKPDPGRELTWLAVVFPFQFEQAKAPGGVEEARFLAAVIDPSAAWGVFKNPPDELRAYAIGSDGYVFAHTHDGYVGSTFASSGLFSKLVRAAFLEGKTSASGEDLALDRTPVRAAFERLGALPFGVVVEQPVAASTKPLLPFAVSAPLGGLLFAMGFAAFYFAWREKAKRAVGTASSASVKDPRSFAERMRAHVATARAESESKDGPDIAAPSGTVAPQAAYAIGLPPPVQASVGQLGGLEAELKIARDALRKAHEEIELIAKFEAEGARSRDPVVTGRKLAELAARLAESPALFFSVHEAVGSAVLEACAGFPVGGTPQLGTFSFSLDERLLEQVSQGEGRGQITSVADHPPLAELVMTRFGVAHFEAWPIVGYGYFGRILAKPRILGVLVLLQPSSAARGRRETIERALRSTGLVYENALLSQ